MSKVLAALLATLVAVSVAGCAGVGLLGTRLAARLTATVTLGFVFGHL